MTAVPEGVQDYVPTPTEIIDKVNRKEITTRRLRQRFDADYSLWRLDKYAGLGENYFHYTSNEPRTNAKKAIGMLSSAAMKLQVPQGNDDRDSRDSDNAKERFLLGNFKANDSRLVKRGSPPLRQFMAWSLIVRGYICGRSMLVKENNRTWADATAWDPRATFWEYGGEGLDWICYRYATSRAAAEKEWNLPETKGADEAVVTVYDWLDDKDNIVLIPDIKDSPVKNEKHGLIDGDGIPLNPGWVYANTLQPNVLLHASQPHLSVNDLSSGSITSTQLDESLADFGESIFADNRHQYETDQMIASIRLNLVDRSLKPVFSIESASGVKQVEFDPWVSGAEIPLKENEKFIIHDAIKSAPDTDALAAKVAQEEQKGGFPIISFGGLPDPISGFAIQNLKGGVADKVMGGAQAMGLALTHTADNWSDHFNTGSFGGMELSGRGRNKKWFSGFTTPEEIRDLPQAEIEIVPELPEDQAGKVQQAMLLAKPMADGMPLLSRYDISEDVLQRQDSDQDMDSIFQMMASQDQLTLAHRMTDSLAKRGDESAQYWQMNWMVTMMQKMQVMIQGQIPPPSITPPQTTSENGFSPEVLPSQAQGIPSPTPGIDTPLQQGPLVPPGTPRNGNLRQGVPPIP